MQAIHKAEGFEAQKIIVLPTTFLEDVSYHPLIKPLYVTDIGFFPHAQYHYLERPAGCDTHIFIYCIEGEGWVMLENNNKLPIRKNTILVIPAQTPHIYGATEADPWSIYWFHLKGEAVERFIQSFDMDNFTLYVPPTLAVRIINLFDQCYETLLYKGYSVKHYLYVSQVMRHLLGMITLLEGESQQDERKSTYVERSIQYMVEHVQSSLTLDELADYISLSKSHFIHLFKEVTGYSPIDYYMRLKIQRACQYLDLTDCSVKEVSKNIGIQDPYYFSRVFSKIMGQSPSDYRKTQKG
jgi:AraC-like DNA-binding protein